MKIKVPNRWTNETIIEGDFENIKDCLEKNIGANLRGANLRGAKEYNMSHEIAIQLMRNHLKKFTIKQQEIGSRIFVLQFCWDDIKKHYGKYMTKIFKILADLGWDEYLKKWEEVK